MSEFYKLPRIHVDAPFAASTEISLPEQTHHYLRNVMRLEIGAQLRLFNGQDGEYLGELTTIGKKNAAVTLQQKLKDQPPQGRKVHLLFAPIRKERMDWLVEKAVELGVTDLHPVLTQNTDNHKIKEDRTQAQIIEAAEQCERLDIPTLHAPQDLFKVLATWDKAVPILAAIERIDAKTLSSALAQGDCAFLIGPSGGFTIDEKEKLAAKPFVTAVSLGDNILRSETAAVVALSSLIV